MSISMPTRHFSRFLAAFPLLLAGSLAFGQADVQFHAPQQVGSVTQPQSFQAEGATGSPIQLVAGPGDNAAGRVQTANGKVANNANTNAAAPNGGSLDSVLGQRLAKISTNLREIPKNNGQMWREFDISPYTKGRSFPAGSNPSQTVVDWILRQTGTKIWHSGSFSILHADEDKLYAYHTKEVLLLVADIVDRFINEQMFNESYTIRVVALSRPDWMTKGHIYLRPIPIQTTGVQGWILEKEGTQLLFQELSRRADFVELSPAQFYIPNGILHNVESKKQRTYLRDVQSNASAINGFVEDRVTIDEGFSVSFIPLAGLDGQTVDAIIKMNVTQIEKMIPLMIDMPTQMNPRQRVQIESPQVACFNVDEQIRWPKTKVLMLDLGTVPVPTQQQAAEEPNNILTNIKKNLQTTSTRANVLLFIERVGNVASPIISGQPATNAVGQPVPVAPAIGAGSSYWQGLR